MKYLLTVPENKEAKALLNFILMSNIFDISEINENIPNEITKKAIEDARQKKGLKFNKIEDLMEELNS